MERVVHVLIIHRNIMSLIPIPMKAKLGMVTLPIVILTVDPHLSLGLLVHSPEVMVHSWWRMLSSRKGFLRDGSECHQ